MEGASELKIQCLELYAQHFNFRPTTHNYYLPIRMAAIWPRLRRPLVQKQFCYATGRSLIKLIFGNECTLNYKLKTEHAPHNRRNKDPNRTHQ